MELTDILQQIDSLKQEAENLQPVRPEYERVFWEKFSMEFNYNSNHIEGNTLTYGQTKLLLLFDRITGDNKGRDVEEMKAHNVALKMITELSSDPESRLSEKLIREINELILVRPFYNDAITQDGQPTKRLITPGKYKSHPNSVLLPDGNMFYYASPEETPALMGDLVEWYNNEKDKIHPIELAARFHYKLVRIHPFDDSNGRTTRLMMNYILMQNGYAPIVIESKKKEMYLAALNKADVGDVDAFVGYIASLSKRWQEIYLKAMRGEKIEEPDDFEKEVELLKKDLSKKNEVEPEKSKMSIQNILKNSIFPFLKNVEIKLKKFDEFFFEKHIIVNGQNFNQRVKAIEEIENSSSNLSTQILNTHQITIHISHTGLIKSGKRNLNYTTLIKLIFKDFEYRVEADSANELILKRYDEFISESEGNSLIDKIAKKELEFLKGQI
jgi:Fic family protein